MGPSISQPEGASHRVVRKTRLPVLKADLANRKTETNLADSRAVMGFAVQRAISLLGWSIKEAAGHIGREPQQISSWISGAERAQFDALFAVEALRMPLIQALAELTGEPVEVTTHISMKRKVG